MKVLGTLATSWTTTTCLMDDSDYVNTIYATATAITTTSSSSCNSQINIQIQATNDYIDSLSIEQLVEFDEMLAQKEAEFDLENGQKAIIPTQQLAPSEKTLKKNI